MQFPRAMVATAGALAALLSLAPSPSCVLAATPLSIDFTSKDGLIYADDEPFYIKGVNWFGFETIEKVPQGLWPSATTVGDILDLLASYDVNALRLPLAIDSILNNPDVPEDQVAGNPDLVGKTYLETLDYVIFECRKRNILVLLDNQRMEAEEPDFPDVAEPDVTIPALEMLAERYCDNPSAWNVLGIDLKNEPKGEATWGSGGNDTDWNVAAAEMGNAVLSKCSRWLIFVQGVQDKIEGETLEWGQAGGSLQGAKEYPVKLKNMKRLVYSPHLISPGVDFKAPWWSESSFPKNMVKIWDSYFGFVPDETGNAVVVGSWGAKMKGDDKKWAVAVSEYLADNKFGSFYWAVNPQSADTGGLLMDDWSTPIDERFELLADLPATSLGDLVKKYADCSGTCDGFGDCVDGTCSCYTGWSGPQCEICSEGDTSACNDYGTCQQDSTCLCDAGADGKYCIGGDCDDVDCGDSEFAGCLNGECVCSFNCMGNDCTPCAANKEGLATAGDGAILCSACQAPTDGAERLGGFGVSSVVITCLSFVVCGLTLSL